MASPAELEPAPVNVRVKISALWTAMLFTFVYVDVFSLFRADVRADIERGKISGFTIGQGFLFGTTVYIVVPTLMVVATLLLQPRHSRVANVVLPGVYGLTIIGGAIGEWGYYVFGSIVEVALLAGVAYFAWTWPRQHPAAPSSLEVRSAEGVSVR